jgi:hypothetical protein
MEKLFEELFVRIQYTNMIETPRFLLLIHTKHLLVLGVLT